MLLRHSLNLTEEANAIETAVEKVLSDGLRTADLARSGSTVSTQVMGAAVVERLA